MVGRFGPLFETLKNGEDELFFWAENKNGLWNPVARTAAGNLLLDWFSEDNQIIAVISVSYVIQIGQKDLNNVPYLMR